MDPIDRHAAIHEIHKQVWLAETAKSVLVEKLSALPSADVPQWIPCSERLPEEDFWAGNGLQYSEDVLITVYNSEEEKTVMDYARSMDGKWYSLTADVFIPNHWNVLAWMPLPEPYEKGEKNEQ